jgi:hypothetical protein
LSRDRSNAASTWRRTASTDAAEGTDMAWVSEIPAK